jgi:butyryl-CoA dehydrogenase
MNFKIEEQHTEFREMLSAFVEKEVRPIAAEVDEKERFPYETVGKMATLGLLGIPIPTKYGGLGGDNVMYAIAVEELSKACATTGVIVSAHTSLCTSPIYEFGTEEQKLKYLPKLAKGRALGAFGLTEANAGTDVAGMQTTALLDGEEWVLNGSKIFITNAGPAEIYIVFAMTDKNKGVKGLSAFIVEGGSPGFTIGKKEKKMGIRGSATCELIFENCRISKGNLLGSEGMGFKIAMMTLDGGRIGIAAQALGIAQGALDESIKYVKETKKHGQPLAKFQNTQFKLAEMDVKIQATRFLVYNAAWKKSEKQAYTVEAARAKLFAADTASEVTRDAVQLYGGDGYMRSYPVERMMRDAKITEIYEGTSEVQKMVIGSSLLR